MKGCRISIKKEKEIRNFMNKGNLVRVKNEAVNKIYEDGTEINRKEEIRKGYYKYIYQLRDNEDTILTDKEQIIMKFINLIRTCMIFKILMTRKLMII